MKVLMFIFSFVLIFGCDFSSNYRGNILNQNPNKNSNKNFLLDIKIETVENGKIKFILSNDNKNSIYYNIKEMPFGEIGKDFFTIYDEEGLIMSYVGKNLYPIKSHEDWIKIRPEESRESEINLTEYYDFPKQGYYDVYFNSIVSVKEKNNISLYNFISEKTVIYLDKTYFPSEEQLNQKAECTSYQLEILDDGKNFAGEKSDYSEKYLYDNGAEEFYDRWFGEVTDERLNHVKDGFARMTPTFNEPWSYSCESLDTTDSCRGYFAWVYSNRPYEVWYCMNHYEAATEEYRAAVMVHEASHWDIAFSSNDYVYGYDNGINLAKESPDKAIDCANNIQHYTIEVSRDGPEPPEPPTGEEKIEINKTTFFVGQIAQIKASGLDDEKTYMVGLFHIGTENNNNPIVKRRIKKSNNGNRIFKMKEKGKFEFHLYERKSDIVLSKIEVVVKKK